MNKKKMLQYMMLCGMIDPIHYMMLKEQYKTPEVSLPSWIDTIDSQVWNNLKDNLTFKLEYEHIFNNQDVGFCGLLKHFLADSPPKALLNAQTRFGKLLEHIHKLFVLEFNSDIGQKGKTYTILDTSNVPHVLVKNTNITTILRDLDDILDHIFYELYMTSEHTVVDVIISRIEFVVIDGVGKISKIEFQDNHL